MTQETTIPENTERKPLAHLASVIEEHGIKVVDFVEFNGDKKHLVGPVINLVDVDKETAFKAAEIAIYLGYPLWSISHTWHRIRDRYSPKWVLLFCNL